MTVCADDSIFLSCKLEEFVDDCINQPYPSQQCREQIYSYSDFIPDFSQDLDLILIRSSDNGRSKFLEQKDPTGISRHVTIYFTKILKAGTENISINHASTEFAIRSASEYKFLLNIGDCVKNYTKEPRESSYDCSHSRVDGSEMHIFYPEWRRTYSINRESLEYTYIFNDTTSREYKQMAKGLCNIISFEKYRQILRGQRNQIRDKLNKESERAEQEKEEQLKNQIEQLKRNKI